MRYKDYKNFRYGHKKQINPIKQGLAVGAVIIFAAIAIIFFYTTDNKIKYILGGVFPSFRTNIEEELVEEYTPTPPIVDDTPLIQPDIIDYDDIIITHENIFDYISSIGALKVRKKLINIDSGAYVTADELDFDTLLSHNFHTDFTGDKPKVLIFHTHASEGFADSKEGEESDTIIGVGDTLADILREQYGVSVLHHKGVYDRVGGKEVREGSYEKMEPHIKRILADNPSIEIAIDLHRDALPAGKHLVTEIDGVQTAQIMFFNGISRLNDNGEPKELDNLPNIYNEENIALSLSLKLLANEMYPDFTRRNYIKPYRYSLHMLPKSLLIEAGSDANTVAEVKNAMKPLARLLMSTFE